MMGEINNSIVKTHFYSKPILKVIGKYNHTNIMFYTGEVVLSESKESEGKINARPLFSCQITQRELSNDQVQSSARFFQCTNQWLEKYCIL